MLTTNHLRFSLYLSRKYPQVIMHALRSIPRRWTAICAFMARRNYPGSLLTYEMPRTKERVRTLAQHREGVCRVGPDCWRCESGGIMRAGILATRRLFLF